MNKYTPKVLFYDVETRPNLGYIWGKYEQNVIEYVEEFSMLCFAYKWQHEKTTHVVGLPDFALYKKDPTNDSELIKALHKLFDEADVVIAHNGDQFDQKITNARTIVNGILPPSPYKQIDTKKVAKRYFRFNSNKLDDLGAILGLGRKIQTGGFSLWLGCMRGDPQAWAKMMRYNKQDVVLLEKVYYKMLPWIENHPGMNVLLDKPEACPNCGKGPLHARGYRITTVSKYQRYQCQNCGHWAKSRKAIRTGVLYV